MEIIIVAKRNKRPAVLTAPAE